MSIIFWTLTFKEWFSKILTEIQVIQPIADWITSLVKSKNKIRTKPVSPDPKPMLPHNYTMVFQ